MPRYPTAGLPVQPLAVDNYYAHPMTVAAIAAAARGQSHRSRVTLPIAFVAFTVLAVLCNLPVWEAPLHRHVGAAGQSDPLLSMWFLSWTPYALSHAHNPFLTSYVNYPRGVNLMWNASTPALGVLLWPITVIWGAVLSDNLITTASFALSAFFAFVAIRRYVRGDLASALGGLLYGFSPYLMAQDIGHAQVVSSAITIPLAFLLLDEALVRQRLKPWLLGVLIAGLGILQFFIFEEIFVSEIVAAGVLILVLACFNPRQVRNRAPYVLKTLGVAAALIAVVIAYPAVVVQLRGPNRLVGYTHNPELFVTDLLNLVVPTSTQLIAPSWATNISSAFTGNISEWDGYLGLPLLVLVAVVVARHWRQPMVRTSIVVAAVITVLSLGAHLHVNGKQLHVPLPWWIPSRLPLLQDVQPNRFTIYVYLCAGFVLAFAINRLWAWRHNIVLSVLVLGVVMAPLIPQLPLSSQPFSVPSYFASAAVGEIPDGAVVLTVPCACQYSMEGLTWQATSKMHFRVLGAGYFFGIPSTGQEQMLATATALAGDSPAPVNDAQRATFLQELRDVGARAVVLGPVPKQAAAAGILSGVLGFSPHSSGDVDVWVLNR